MADRARRGHLEKLQQKLREATRDLYEERPDLVLATVNSVFFSQVQAPVVHKKTKATTNEDTEDDVSANSGIEDDNLTGDSDGAFAAIELAKPPTKRGIRSSDVTPVKSEKGKNKEKEATNKQETAVTKGGRELKKTDRDELVGNALAILRRKKSQGGGA